MAGSALSLNFSTTHAVVPTIRTHEPKPVAQHVHAHGSEDAAEYDVEQAQAERHPGVQCQPPNAAPAALRIALSLEFRQLNPNTLLFSLSRTAPQN
jgi:hypothetical protein